MAFCVLDAGDGRESCSCCQELKKYEEYEIHVTTRDVVCRYYVMLNSNFVNNRRGCSI